jgi:ubiquitin C-terminal hydrolase
MSTDVNFPMQDLDISPYLSEDLFPSPSCDIPSRKYLYDLTGVAHHSGSLNGGHYIAHVDTRDAHSSSQNWVCFNDSRVSPTSSAAIGGPSAYILFYRLKSTQPSSSSAADTMNNHL